jgi:hypothetical protein
VIGSAHAITKAANHTEHAEKHAAKADASTHGPAVKVTLSPAAELLLKKEKTNTDKGTAEKAG